MIRLPGFSFPHNIVRGHRTRIASSFRSNFLKKSCIKKLYVLIAWEARIIPLDHSRMNEKSKNAYINFYMGY